MRKHKMIVIYRRPNRIAKAIAKDLASGKADRTARTPANLESLIFWVRKCKPELVILDEELKGYRKIASEIGSEILPTIHELSPNTKTILISKKKMKTTATYNILSRFNSHDMAKLVDNILGI
jgi:hypothetical protein